MRTTSAIILLLAGCAVLPRANEAPQVSVTAQHSGTDALLIAVAPVNDDVAWVSGAQGTWLRTLNGGTTWSGGRVPGADSLQFRDVHAVDATTAYLLSIGNGPQSRIYKTTDAGVTWQLQFTNQDPRGFYDCFDFWNADRALVIGDAIDGKMQLLTTADAGRTWSPVPVDGLPATPEGEGSFAASGLCVETQRSGLAWIVASNPQQGRILHTADFGRTWSSRPVPITTHNGSGPQSVSFLDREHGIVLGGGYGSQPDDVLAAITRDGGKTWQPRARPPLRTGIWGGVYVPGARIPTVVAGGPAGLVYSRDQAATWIKLDTLNYWSVGFASPRAGWAVGARGRISKLSVF